MTMLYIVDHTQSATTLDQLEQNATGGPVVEAVASTPHAHAPTGTIHITYIRVYIQSVYECI